MKTVVCILNVKDELLENGDFTTEMGWVESSGIYLKDYSTDKNVAIAFKDGFHVICE
mgnify:FL=1